MWTTTDRGDLAYGWPEIETALVATADVDWADFFTRYIKGSERLPIESVLQPAGLRLIHGVDESTRIARDPDASAGARERWGDLVNRH